MAKPKRKPMVEKFKVNLRLFSYSNNNFFGTIFSMYGECIAAAKLGPSTANDADSIYRSVNILMKHLDFLIKYESIKRNIK